VIEKIIVLLLFVRKTKHNLVLIHNSLLLTIFTLLTSAHAHTHTRKKCQSHTVFVAQTDMHFSLD